MLLVTHTCGDVEVDFGYSVFKDVNNTVKLNAINNQKNFLKIDLNT